MSKAKESKSNTEGCCEPFQYLHTCKDLDRCRNLNLDVSKYKNFEITNEINVPSAFLCAAPFPENIEAPLNTCAKTDPLSKCDPRFPICYSSGDFPVSVPQLGDFTDPCTSFFYDLKQIRFVNAKPGCSGKIILKLDFIGDLCKPEVITLLRRIWPFECNVKFDLCSVQKKREFECNLKQEAFDVNTLGGVLKNPACCYVFTFSYYVYNCDTILVHCDKYSMCDVSCKPKLILI